MPDVLDPVPLLELLHERGIEHIVVGGFAVNAHGFNRVTVRACGLDHLRDEASGRTPARSRGPQAPRRGLSATRAPARGPDHPRPPLPVGAAKRDPGSIRIRSA
jgi:hypothetical protein